MKPESNTKNKSKNQVQNCKTLEPQSINKTEIETKIEGNATTNKSKNQSKDKINKNKKQVQKRKRTPETVTIIETADIKAAEMLIEIFNEPNKAAAQKLIKKIDSTDDGIHTIIERIESGTIII